ncbi:MAG: outer membrane beta-barrel protein [Alcanivoracaceae bacterium]|jgi:hypothetical protein|nr:outer membrane beta-barrel protein [Alcanivoracaceae bacterium]
MKKFLLAITLSALAAPALAEFPVGKIGVKLSPSTDFDLDGLPEADGTAIGAYGEFGSSNLFAYADIQKSDLDIQNVDLDIDETRFGVGARSVSSNGELSVRVESYDVEIVTSIAGASAEDEDDGFAVHLGGAVNLNEKAALFGSIGMLSLDDTDGTEFQLGVRGKITDSAEIYGAWRSLSLEEDSNVEADLTDLRIGVNLLF